MGKDTVSDFIVKRLAEWGVKRIFGYPGDGINGLMGAMRRAEEANECPIHFVQARHEELAAFMACAHAKFTGEVGVCVATSGPGAIHLLNGLYDAKLDHQPVVAIVGQQHRRALGSDYQQEVDLLSLFKDVAHEYVHMATNPAQVRQLIDRAMRIAHEQRTVTCVILPNDVQEMDAVETPPRLHGSTFTGVGHGWNVTSVSDTALIPAAQVLNKGERVAILVGAGALHATAEIIKVAELLGAGIAKALLGKAAVPDDLPYVTGAIGLLGTKPSWELMENCDTLLMVGSTFPYCEFLPREGQARGVQIDIDGRNLSLRYPMEVNLIGDSQQTLQALIPLLRRKKDTAWRKQIEKEVDRWWRVLETRAMQDADPINPQRVFWELSSQLPDNCIVTCDSGSAANWYARDLKFRGGMKASLSGGLATMGPAVPYAIAAKFAFPDRPIIAAVGDGAMQMNGLNALITIAHQWQQWENPCLVVLVLNNGDLNQVTWEQRVMEGDPKYEASQVVPAFPYAEYSRMLGLGGIRVDQPGALAGAWEQALSERRPTVLEVPTDPNVPPIPPHITFEQAKSYLMSIMKGDPDARGILGSSIRDTWASLFPARGDRDRKKEREH